MAEASAKWRFIRPAARGVFRWLDAPGSSPERTLFESLVLVGNDSWLDLHRIGEAVNLPPRDAARALFALNRSESVSVIENAPDRFDKGWAQSGLSGLAEDLAALIQPGQSLLLASDDGFAIASAGCSAYEADVLAVPRAPADGAADPRQAHLQFGDKGFRVIGSHPLDRNQMSWLSVAYRLITALSPAAPAPAESGD